MIVKNPIYETIQQKEKEIKQLQQELDEANAKLKIHKDMAKALVRQRDNNIRELQEKLKEKDKEIATMGTCEACKYDGYIPASKVQEIIDERESKEDTEMYENIVIDIKELLSDVGKGEQ